MTSREFCYWLQGFFEVGGEGITPGCQTLTGNQIELIKRHLSMVFKHEIDPSYPNGPELSKIHGQPDMSNVQVRC